MDTIRIRTLALVAVFFTSCGSDTPSPNSNYIIEKPLEVRRNSEISAEEEPATIDPPNIVRVLKVVSPGVLEVRIVWCSEMREKIQELIAEEENKLEEREKDYESTSRMSGEAAAYLSFAQKDLIELSKKRIEGLKQSLSSGRTGYVKQEDLLKNCKKLR